MESHPYADIFPMMSAEEYAGLVADIRDRGMRESIVIFEGKILDGRNRAAACKEIGFEPEVHYFRGSQQEALDFVVSRNIHRRHLDSSQRAMVGVRYKKHLTKLARERQKEGGKEGGSTAGRGRPKVDRVVEQIPQANPIPVKSEPAPKSRAVAAEKVGTNERYINAAEKISDSAPDLAEKVHNGQMNLPQAKRELDRREKAAALEAKAKEAETAIFAAGPERDLGWEIITGNCVEVLASLEMQKPRLIFADPPYNIGVDYGDHYDDKQDPDDYIQWADSWIKACTRLLADDGSLWLLIGDEYAAEYGCLIKDAGLTIRNWIIWYETFGVNCTGKFNRSHRHLFYAVKSEKKFVFNVGDWNTRPSDRQEKYGDKRAAEGGKLWDDVWGVNPLIPRVVDNDKERMPGFPTQLPSKLLDTIIRTASDPGDLVLDPFNGSGTTGAAAVAWKRRYVGIEKSTAFAELARARLMALSGELVHAS